MSEVTIYSQEKKKIGSVNLPEAFDGKANTALLHQVVVAQQTNQRQGTSKVKNRHEVRGSTRKIYRQKGTGGARHGDIKAPLFVGGGRAFGPKPRDYEVVLPKKIRRAALKEAVIQRRSEGRLWILDTFDFDKPKTKRAFEIFKKFEIPAALVVLDEAQTSAEKSIRNLEKFGVCRIEALNVLEILRYDHLVMTRGALEKFVQVFGGES